MAIAEIFSGLKLVLDLVTKRGKERSDLADLLDKIADSMTLTINQSPGERAWISYEHLQEFAIYCKHFDSAVGSKLTSKTKMQLNDLLEHALDDDELHHDEMMLEALLGKERRPSQRLYDLRWDEFSEVRKAVGQLKAYANLLRAGGSAV